MAAITVQVIFYTIRAKPDFYIAFYGIIALSNIRRSSVKKITYHLGKVIAALTLKVAQKGAGLPSNFGWFQPKVPENLCK